MKQIILTLSIIFSYGGPLLAATLVLNPVEDGQLHLTAGNITEVQVKGEQLTVRTNSESCTLVLPPGELAATAKLLADDEKTNRWQLFCHGETEKNSSRYRKYQLNF